MQLAPTNQLTDSQYIPFFLVVAPVFPVHSIQGRKMAAGRMNLATLLLFGLLYGFQLQVAQLSHDLCPYCFESHHFNPSCMFCFSLHDPRASNCRKIVSVIFYSVDRTLGKQLSLEKHHRLRSCQSYIIRLYVQIYMQLNALALDGCARTSVAF